MRVIRTRITELIKENKTTKISLARKLGVSRDTVQNWDKGRSMPSMTNSIMLVGILKCKIEQLSEIIEC